MSSKLAGRNYVVMIDKSGSMSTNDTPGGKSRWAYAQEQTEAIAREAHKHDPDGIDVVVFAGQPKVYENVTPEKVTQIFTENSPSGSTDTAKALAVVFEKFNKEKKNGSTTPTTVVCITDGTPDDEKAVEKAIIAQANSQDRDEELGISFCQVGKDEAARKWLKKLDDELQSAGAKFDIVDTKNNDEMESISIVQLLEEAVED